MSIADYNVGELWKNFMFARQKAINFPNGDLISAAIYPSDYFANYDPANIFEKWAATEVSSLDNVPKDMEILVLPDGLYAVFDYKGASEDNSIFHYIFGSWLPNSEYLLDDRPHFEVLGDKYKNNNPDSEEEIWLPIKPAL